MPSTTKSHGTSSMIAAAPGPALLATGPSPLSWWKFEETGTGAPAYDTGGGGIGATALDNSATTVPASTVAPVHFPNVHARNFPAGSSGMSSGPWAAHNLLDNFSVSCWVKPAAFTTAMTIMSRMNDAAGIGWNVWTDGPANGQPGAVLFQAMNGPGVRNYAGASSPFLQLNVWSHVAAVMQSGTRSVYINGAQVGVTDSSPMKPTTPDMITSLGEWASDLSHPWNGDLDDLRYYNVALTPAQIATLAGGDDLAGGVGNLIGYWKLDEVGTAQTAIDSSPVGADATEHGGFSVDVTTPAPIAAPTLFSNPHSRRFGQPPNNWLNAGVQPLHGLTQNFTVACWYRSLTTGVAAVPLVTHQNAFPTTKGWGLMIAGTPPPGPGRAGLPASTLAPSLQACTPSGATPIFADVAMPRGVWTHIAGVFSATTGRLYVNGVKQSAVLSTMPAASTDLPTYLGRDYSNTGGPTQIVGDLDEVRIYNVALTSDQVSSLAAGLDPFAVTIVTKTHTTDSLVTGPPATASFVQRDNWRNGAWVGHYGKQGVEVIYSDATLITIPGVTYNYTYTSGSVDSWGRPGVFTDPRFYQVPSNHAQTSAGVVFATGTGKVLITFLLDDGKAHAISIAGMNIDTPSRRYHINVYDNDTNALLDGPQALGDYCTTDVYLTWNVSGHVRFECVVDVSFAGVGALFVDPPRSVGGKTHTTDTALRPAPVTVTKPFTTDALLRATVVKTHTTDTVLLGTRTRVYYTDSLRQATAVKTHTTDTLFRTTVVKTFTTDAQLRATVVKTHTTDTWLCKVVTRTHTTDALLRGTVVKTHTTDTGLCKVVTRTHDTSTLLGTTVSTTHFTDTSLAITNHLISYWKLDEGGTGQVAIDSMSLGANATDVLGTTVPSAPATLHFTNPSGRTLPGDGTYLDTGVQPAHSFTQNFTIAGWVRPAVVDVAVVVSHMPNPLNRGWGLLLLNDATPALYACDAAGAHAVYAYGNQAPVGVWMHLAGVYYDNNTMGLFVNGRKFPANASIDPSPDLPTYIGKWCSGAPYYGASSNADFDDIRIYDIALTDAQIGSLAAGILDPLAVTVATRAHSTDAALVVPPTTVTLTHDTDASFATLPAVFAYFVQRDNWRNGAWINHYGAQGYSLFRNGIPYALPPESTIPDVMPPGVTYTMYAAYDQGLDPAVYTDPRLLQDPTRPGYTTKAIYYNGDPSRYAVFRFDDGLSHAVSLYQLDYDHEHARYTITVYDDATGTLLDGPREVGDYETTGVYLTWNVRGHIRFYSTPEVAYSYTSALFVDPPRSVGAQAHNTDTALLGGPVTVTKTHSTDALCQGTILKTHSTDSSLVPTLVTSAMFVQRDNWKNGAWKGHYGSQGVEVIYSDATVISIPDVTYEYHWTSGSIDSWGRPGVFTDPRFYQVPSDPVQTSYGVLYAAGVGQKVIITFLFDDGLAHALSIATANADTPSRRYHINVYDNDTDTLLDGPKDVGDYYTTDVYMTWNVQGHVRFECVVDNNMAGIGALFVDPPRSVGSKTHQTDVLVAIAPTVVTTTHGTDTSIAVAPPAAATAAFVQRDNWLGGKWIGTYGTQGDAVFLTGTPTVLPPKVSYKVAGGKYDCWLPPGTYTDPRLPQVPGQPDKTAAAVYHTEDTECFFFNFDDGLKHAVSIFSLDYDQGDLRHQIEVYDDDTDTRIDGPRDVGDQYTNSVYMTWNVTGHIRFELVTDAENAVATAWFIDPPIIVGGAVHGTDTLISGTGTGVKTHKTDSLLEGLVGQGVMMSRSRSQRVGTRTLAFGDQP